MLSPTAYAATQTRWNNKVQYIDFMLTEMLV